MPAPAHACGRRARQQAGGTHGMRQPRARTRPDRARRAAPQQRAQHQPIVRVRLQSAPTKPSSLASTFTQVGLAVEGSRHRPAIIIRTGYACWGRASRPPPPADLACSLKVDLSVQLHTRGHISPYVPLYIRVCKPHLQGAAQLPNILQGVAGGALAGRLGYLLLPLLVWQRAGGDEGE
jgi:hypothetical protein